MAAVKSYFASNWSGLDPDVLQTQENAADTLNGDINTNLLIVTLLLGITMGTDLELPDPCDGVNLLDTCERNESAIMAHSTFAMACNLLCICTMLINGQLLLDIARVPSDRTLVYIINSLPVLGAGKFFYESAIYAFTGVICSQILVTLGRAQATACMALLFVGTIFTIYMKKVSVKAADDAIYSSSPSRPQGYAGVDTVDK